MKLGVALSGGGIRGIAHAGALKALEDNGIKISSIGGTSSGSLIASLYAMRIFSILYLHTFQKICRRYSRNKFRTYYKWNWEFYDEQKGVYGWVKNR